VIQVQPAQLTTANGAVKSVAGAVGLSQLTRTAHGALVPAIGLAVYSRVDASPLIESADKQLSRA